MTKLECEILAEAWKKNIRQLGVSSPQHFLPQLSWSSLQVHLRQLLSPPRTEKHNHKCFLLEQIFDLLGWCTFFYLGSHLHYKVPARPHNLFLDSLKIKSDVQTNNFSQSIERFSPCSLQLKQQDRRLYQELSMSWHKRGEQSSWSWSGSRDFQRQCLNNDWSRNITSYILSSSALPVPALRASLTASIPSYVKQEHSKSALMRKLTS